MLIPIIGKGGVRFADAVREELESIEHVILVCRLYEGERVSLFQGMREDEGSWSEGEKMSVVGFFR